MSFLDKIKNKGKNEGNDDFDAGPQTDAGAAPEDTQDFQPSIITTAQPTPEFQDTSAGYQPSASAPESPTPMPAVARQPEQRRTGLLTALVAVGLIGTATTVSWSLISSTRAAHLRRGSGGDAVAASGEGGLDRAAGQQERLPGNEGSVGDPDRRDRLAARRQR